MYFSKLTNVKYSISIIILGAISCIAQLILLREFISVLNGNELSTGIILANWMLATAIGSRLGMLIKHKPNDILIIIVQIFVSLLPAISLFLLRLLRYSIFFVGLDLSIFEIALFSFLLLLPYCILSGFSFTLYSITMSEDENQINFVYSRDNLGMVIGGILFSFVLVFFFSASDITLILIWLGSLSIVILLGKERKIAILMTILLLLSLQFIFSKLDIEKITKGLVYKNQEIIYNKESPYGNIIITRTQEQINYYCNGILIANSQSIAEDEELAHFAMIQKENIKNVMMISGVLSGVVDEVKKYNPQCIDIIEINPEIIKLANYWTNNLNDKVVTVINSDPRTYVISTKKLYDVVINCMPSADNLLSNKYFTSEFIGSLKQKMTNNAVLIFSGSATENYVSDKSCESISILYNTLKQHFQNVIIIPSLRNYFLASDSSLSIDKIMSIFDRDIATEYVPYYLDLNSLASRSEDILSRINSKFPINKDFQPSYYLSQINIWQSRFNTNSLLILAIFLFPIAFVIRSRSAVNFSLWTIGFTSLGSEIVIIFAFQIIFGYVYYMIGVIITVFMLGIALGSVFSLKFIQKPKYRHIIISQILLLFIYISMPYFVTLMDKMQAEATLNVVIFNLLMFIIAFLTGSVFGYSSKVRTSRIEQIAGESYSSDLFGSAVGAVFISTYLLPQYGLFASCLVLAFLSLLSIIFLIIENRIKYARISN